MNLKKLFQNKKSPKVVVTLVILVFAICALYLAFNLKMGISPDSSYHLEVSQAYSTTLGIPQNTPDTYKWRDITRIPYLSLWINGRILNLNEITFNFNEIFLLRFFNVLASIGTLIFMYLISKKFIKSRWGEILPVFLLSNTLMFVFLSSSINYDNLALFFCTGAIYYFVKYLQNSRVVKNTLYMWVFLLLASLTKEMVLPLAFILVIIWFVILLRKRVLRKEFFKQFRKFVPIFLLLVTIVLVVLNLKLYGRNVLEYGELVPKCTDILTHEQCLENGVYYRDIYKIPVVFEGNLTEAFPLIINGERIGPLRYIPFWVVETSRKIFGIMGDRSLFMKYEYLPPYFIYFFIGIYLIFKNRKKLITEDKALISISLFYMLVLIYYHNYQTYIKQNWKDLALQGRYVFPVLGIMYIIFSKYFLKIKNKKLLRILMGILIVLFLLGNFGYFFVYVPNDWFM